MLIYKKLSKHPRIKTNKKQKAILIGGTGSTGSILLEKLLKSPHWEQVTSIARKPVLNGRKHSKLTDITISSFNELLSTKNNWNNHDVFFNCIGTTKKRSGSAKNFQKIELDISIKAAKMASEANIPHASLISAKGANPNQWSKDWIHPLFYLKIMGKKEQSLINENFVSISIFRPGMLIRSTNNNLFQQIFDYTSTSLRVEQLADAMIRDAKSENKINEPLIFEGNQCIKSSIKL